MPTAAARAEGRPESRWRTPGSKHGAADARSRAPRSPAALRPGGATAPPHQQAPARRTRARRWGNARASAPRSRQPAPAGAAAGACPRARVGRPAPDLSLAGVAAAARTADPATAAATSCANCGSASLQLGYPGLEPLIRLDQLADPQKQRNRRLPVAIENRLRLGPLHPTRLRRNTAGPCAGPERLRKTPSLQAFSLSISDRRAARLLPEIARCMPSETTEEVICRANGETGATGLEPATSGVTGRRSNQLNYAPSGATSLPSSLPN